MSDSLPIIKPYHRITRMKVADIIPDKNNPNKMTDERLDSLEYSMEKFGDIQPIVIDESTNKIASGHQRFEIYKRNGVEEIDVIRYPFKNEEERMLFLQVANKLHGEHDVKQDISYMEHLLGYDPDELKSLLGFDEQALDILRQRAAEEDEQLQNIKEKEEAQQEQETVVERNDFLSEYSTCPNCGHILKGL